MLDTPIEYLKTIGPQKAELLKKELGIFVYHDLLQHYPFRYIDRTKIQTISEINEDTQYVQLRGQVVSLQLEGQQRAKRLVVVFRDATGVIELVWFQGHQWMAQKLQLGVDYLVYGKVAMFKGRVNIAHPEVELYAEEVKRVGWKPIYSTTEKLKTRGLGSEGIRKAMEVLVHQLRAEHVNETLTEELLSHHKLLPLFEAVRAIHFPTDYPSLKAAERRIKFDELFYIQLRLLRINKGRAAHVRGYVFNRVGEHFTTFFETHLPFPLTSAQKKVIREMRIDMGSGRQMNRLVQGDVGSGKTLVALMCMLLSLDNGFQACLMAPTEILAQQHFETFTGYLKEMSVKIALLTGSVKGKQRKQILQGLQDGEIHILIGTHALIEQAVVFKRLGLVVIDEQHRFGVGQRARLREKSEFPPHMMIMTATPIPRTLAMTLYGDLDTSVIDELPPGRKPISTYHYKESKRLALYGFIRNQISLGRQVYIVYPLIQESETLDYQNLQAGYDQIVHEFPPPKYQVSIVHGKLTPEQKDFEMKRFVNGETQIMVATTVIEVGVNVPNASVMVIESAERFGLSQLHQLRGRVGRGAEQSYCILMTGYKLSAESRLRMETMERTNDGFEISEVDLKLRGPGDLEGTRQSGVLDLKLADLVHDGDILKEARETAQQILDEDPELTSNNNLVYRQQLERRSKNRPDWSLVG